MPKLSELAVADHRSLMLAVLRMTYEFKDPANPKDGRWTVSEACAQVGLSVGQYYHWLSKSEEAIDTFRELIADYGRVELASIMSVQQEITDRLILDALSPTADPIVRLNIIRYLNERLELMTDRHKARGGDAAREFMRGLALQEVPSKFGSEQAQTVNFKPREDGSLDVTFGKHVEVVEGEARDPAGDTEVPTAEPIHPPLPRLAERGSQQSQDLAQQLLSQTPSGDDELPWS